MSGKGLEPCPRCGLCEDLYLADAGPWWEITCLPCGGTVYATTRDEAIVRWNHRTPGPATARIAEILREYRRAPDFREVVSVTLTLTREEAAAFLAEIGPAKEGVEP